MELFLEKKTFTFNLLQSLKTSSGVLSAKKGWIIKILTSSGKCGWGEIAPIKTSEFEQCENILKSLGSSTTLNNLEESISDGPGAFGFGMGSALAEIKEITCSGNPKWHLNAPTPSILLPDNDYLLSRLDELIESIEPNRNHLTVKWKVAKESNDVEENLRAKILERLPNNARLRLDANGGWDREKATCWGNFFAHDSRLEWIEQPLPADDIEGLLSLSKSIPIALDESLIANPLLKKSWKGWQIRRPSLEGDPRLLLKELQCGISHICISTAFETGIGRRCINHLAAMQQKTVTPTAPGLAPGWRPKESLFNNNPNSVWEAI